MKEGYVVKNDLSGQPFEGEMTLINNYTRRVLDRGDVYVFSVVLCDNDVDREYERFTDDALDVLAKLYVGKTGITDHDTKSQNQTARIISCKVERIQGKTNKINGPYRRLTARAYMPRSEKNLDFILALDSGIKKEVSVGCTVDSITCSICGANLKTGSCVHVKGKSYKDNLCYAKLDKPSDAYEWSFVAVPAQRHAGVIKSFGTLSRNGGDFSVKDIVEKFIDGDVNKIDEPFREEFKKFFKSLQNRAAVGDVYHSELKKEVIKLSSIVNPELNIEVMKGVADKLSIKELKSFRDSYKSKSIGLMPFKPQLNIEETKTVDKANLQFQI